MLKIPKMTESFGLKNEKINSILKKLTKIGKLEIK